MIVIVAFLQAATGAVATPAQIKSGSVSDRSYPATARAAGTEGMTAVEFTVDAKGRVRRCSPVAASDTPQLDAASCRIVTGWRYSPARDAAGRGVDSQVTQRFAWRVANACPPNDGSICITARR